jgi:hypothetical protein
MNPLFLNPFMKKLTRERVVPTISARVCWLTFSTADFDLDCLPARASSKRIRAGYTFLSEGWWSLLRPSSSHLTIASSSFACSTVPNSPVGFPKLPKPLDAISAIEFLVGGGWLDERRLLGTV